ncbi:putative lipoprotein [Treponema primitia ZAS-2]|uniref:Putative lipoprotein n=1 Tax=Treponema primitia (strain ATCC BAA-887 / DSM 12427 / ZAS-2) TaxID=545694 RepID=F5YIQ5_TREPZ|nr:hypothetical protein [Treponema primitia]AEF83755.1 putative lipoprotein [Treponema primitia ZAS-2]
MQKTAASLVLPLLIVFLTFSCGIPTSMPTAPSNVMLKGNSTVRVGSGNFKMVDYLPFDSDGMGDDVKIYDYNNPSDTAQSFLIHYAMKPMSFDFKDQLQSDDSSWAIRQEFNIPSMNEMKPKDDLAFNLQPVFDEFEKKARGEVTIPSLEVISWPDPVYPVLKPNLKIKLDGFSNATFKEGEIAITFSLQEPLPNTQIVLTNVELVDSANELIKSQSGSANPATNEALIIPLKGRTIHNDAGLTLQTLGLTVRSSAAGTVKLKMKIEFRETLISDADGLNLGDVTIVIPDTPIGVSFPPDFIRATIKTGIFHFNVDVPPKEWKGFDIKTYDLTIDQPKDFRANPGFYLKDAVATDKPGEIKLKIQDGTNLNVAESIRISGTIKIKITPGAAISGIVSKEIKRPLDAKIEVLTFASVTVSVWDAASPTHSTLEHEMIEDLGEISQWIHTLVFNPKREGMGEDEAEGVGISLEFDECIKDMKMKVEIPVFDIEETKDLYAKHPDKPPIVFTNTSSDYPITEHNPYGGFEWVIPDNKYIEDNKIKFKITISPTDGHGDYDAVNKWLTLKDLAVNDGDGAAVELDPIVGQASLILDWYSALVRPGGDGEDQGNFIGKIPDDDDGMPLSDAVQYNGILFEICKAYLYISGPSSIEPVLSFESAYRDSSDTIIEGPTITPEEDQYGEVIGKLVGKFPDLEQMVTPQESFPIFNGSAGDIFQDSEQPPYVMDITEIINDSLREQYAALFLSYKINISNGSDDGVWIIHEEIEDDVKITVNIFIDTPLKFMPNGDAPGSMIMQDVDLGDDDLFWRSGPEDNSYFDYVKYLNLKINMNNVGFTSGNLKLVNRDEQYPVVIPILALGQLVQDVTPELDTLKNTYPFVPDLVLEFPTEKFQLNKGCSINFEFGITVVAEYEFELEDMDIF